MAGERTFVVKILGNADGAITAFKKLAREGQDTIGQLQSVGNSLGNAFDVVKKGALIALGAVTAVAGAATAAVYAAAADEASQKSLEAQLIRSAGATTAQVQATEAFIEKAMMATGIADDELRPAFGNLARATGDLDKSQRLFNLALDISAATQRDLTSVTLGLGRAATGNIGALTRLGIPLDEGAKKSKDFSAILGTLEQQFGGAAATAADTFSGRVKILKTSFGEVVEEIGFALLPAFEKIVAFLQTRILPALKAAVDGFKEEGLTGAVKYFAAAMGPVSFTVINAVEGMILGVIEFEQAIVNFFKPAFAFIDVLRAIASSVTGGDGIITVEQMLIDRTNNVTGTFDRLRNSVTSTSNALNLQGNKISPLIDQTDRLGNKVLPKAKEATDDWSNSLTGLNTKTGGAAKTVETAKQKFEKYTDALKGSTSAQKAFTNAQKGSVQAQQSLNDANTALTTAQENFTQAINGYGADSIQAKDAQRELLKAQRGVENSGYRVEESVFAVRDAEKKLAEVRADPESNPQMIREAEISLAQAKLAVSDATDAQYEATSGLSKAQTVLNEAVTGAIVGSATYTIFLDAVNRAKEQQETASERLTDALDREKEAYENLAEAIKKVADAAAASGRANLTIPTLPTVPTPGGSSGGGSSGGGGGNTIVVNTGIGTNGVEAGRQIVQLLQQYTAVDAFAIDRLGFAPRR
jgi:hypothetical protein